MRWLLCQAASKMEFHHQPGLIEWFDNGEEGLERGYAIAARPSHPADGDAALKSAEIRFQLEKTGTRIGPYDLQLSDQALSLDLTLVTHNTREFKRVNGLRFEDWEAELPPP